MKKEINEPVNYWHLINCHNIVKKTYALDGYNYQFDI